MAVARRGDTLRYIEMRRYAAHTYERERAYNDALCVLVCVRVCVCVSCRPVALCVCHK